MWRLTALGATVSSVNHHANAKMVHLNADGKVVHNTAIYEVCPTTDNAITTKIWPDGVCFAVNSVHSELEDKLTVVDGVEIQSC